MTGGAHSGHGAVSHTPERSGLPSAVRGAGAFRSTLPSAVFGMAGEFGKDGHCANAVVAAAVQRRTTSTRFTRAFSLNTRALSKARVTQPWRVRYPASRASPRSRQPASAPDPDR